MEVINICGGIASSEFVYKKWLQKNHTKEELGLTVLNIYYDIADTLLQVIT